MAQLGARFNGIEEVGGSTPPRSTKFSCCDEQIISSPGAKNEPTALTPCRGYSGSVTWRSICTCSGTGLDCPYTCKNIPPGRIRNSYSTGIGTDTW